MHPVFYLKDHPTKMSLKKMSLKSRPISPQQLQLSKSLGSSEKVPFKARIEARRTSSRVGLPPPPQTMQFAYSSYRDITQTNPSQNSPQYNNSGHIRTDFHDNPRLSQNRHSSPSLKVTFNQIPSPHHQRY